jgi:predicted ATPase
MSGYLTKIKTKIPFSDKEVDIDVDGKTLILTGGNGCGKTQLMDYIFSKLKESVIDRKNYTIQQLNNSLSSYQHSLKDLGPAHQSYNHFKEQMEITKARIKEVEEPSIIIKDIEGFIVKYQAFKAILISFEAMRKSEIKNHRR